MSIISILMAEKPELQLNSTTDTDVSGFYTDNCVVVKLSPTKALAVYRLTQGTNYYGKAIVLVVGEDNIITTGTEKTFLNLRQSLYISASALSDTKVIVVFKDVDFSGRGAAIILTVAEDNTITAGSVAVFRTGVTNHLSVAALSETKAIVVHSGLSTTYGGGAHVLDISGSTITPGGEYAFNSGTDVSYCSVASVTSNKAIVTYQDGDDSDAGAANILNVSGNVITTGTKYLFNDDGVVSNISVSNLSEDKAIVVYSGYVDAVKKGLCNILDIDSDVIIPGASSIFNDGGIYIPSVSAISDDQAVVAFNDQPDSVDGQACVLTLYGSLIATGDEVPFYTSLASDSSVSLTALSRTKLIVFFDTGSTAKACVFYLE